MTLSFNKRLSLTFALALVAIILVTGGAIMSIRDMVASTDGVAHAEAAVGDMNSIQALMSDWETAARAYFLAGSDDFLQPYQVAKGRITARLDDLEKRLAGNSPQLEDEQKLRKLIEARLSLADGLINTRKNSGLNAAMDRLRSVASDYLAGENQIKSLINSMVDSVNGFLTQQNVLAQQRAQQTMITVLGAGTVGLLLLGWSGWVMMRQLNARQAAEAALTKNRAELQGIVDNSPAGIFLKDLDGRYLLLNEPMKHLYGFEPAACLGRTAVELFSAERAALINKEDAEVVAKGRGQEIEFEMTGQDGLRRVFRTLKFPLRDASGRIYAVGGISSDITERRYMVNELRQALDAAEIASRSKSQFLANMSHELRTPLNSIIGFSEILSDRLIGPLSDKQFQYTTNILSSGRHLLHLINDLLDLAKIESGKVQLEPEQVKIAALVGDAVAHMRGLADRKGITLEVLPMDPALAVWLDAARTKQIIYNLVNNAIKFTPKGGCVTVAAKQVAHPPAPSNDAPVDSALGERLPGNWLSLTVKDNGMGIDSKDIDRIFVEFEQVDSTYSRQQEGTGLGLTLVRKLANLHGGYVWAESAGRLNQGSLFCVLLPLDGPSAKTTLRSLTKAAQFSVTPHKPVATEAAPNGVNGQPLVLIVEDDQQASHLIAEHLAMGGYRTACVRTGEEALQKAAELQPSAITLDVVLPDANGMEVLARLKAAPATSHIPVIIISVTDDRQLGLSLGAAEFLVKPVGAERLLEVLARAQARAKKNIQDVLVVDDELAARESITAILEPRGYEVWTSSSGQEALLMVARQVPDVAIIDLMMPGMSGFELVKHLRQNPITRELPICVYTAKDLSSSELRWLREQSAAVTPKPFRELLMDELQRIRANPAPS